MKQTILGLAYTCVAMQIQIYQLSISYHILLRKIQKSMIAISRLKNILTPMPYTYIYTLLRCLHVPCSLYFFLYFFCTVVFRKSSTFTAWSI